MSTKEEGKLQKATPTQLAKPDFIPESNAGLDEVGIRDMILPRLGLCQTNTHARIKSDPKYIQGLEEGEFFNSLTGKIYGDKIQVVPLFFYHSRIMFRDMKQGGGILCQAPDGKHCQLNAGGPCIHASWGAGGEPPECTEFFNYPSLVYEGEDQKTQEWIVVSLKTTGLDAGRTLNSLMRLRGTASYAGVYELSSVPDKNAADQSYFTWIAKNGTPPWVDKPLYDRAEQMSKVISEGIKAGSITVDSSDDVFAERDSEV